MRHRVCIVSCTAHKRDIAARAEDLYCSELFFKSRRLAQAEYDSWLILSAKHGLLQPCHVIEPYDRKLTTLSKDQKRSLATRVSEQSRALLPKDAEIDSVCGEEYDELLTQAGMQFFSRREFALSIGRKLKALGEATDMNKIEKLLDATYKVIGRLDKEHRRKRLNDVVGDRIPESGIYIFFDDGERRLKRNDQLRVVRVGTHGVAMGSKASLRNRIRTHLGTQSGDGNHRSSIFRLHIGRSLINASLQPDVLSWGISQSNKLTLQNERALEREVSKYLRQLLVILVDVPGKADKNNDRAYLEQNLIALISNTCRPLDPPSCEWLGLRSAKKEIRKSGLWNVNHVDQAVDPGFLEILDYYVSFTVGKKPLPRRPLAPANWQRRLRGNTNQLELL